MKSPRGFIALFSILLISAVLLLMATGGSFAGFYGRQDALGYEYKERSNSLAHACLSQTLLSLANDPAHFVNYGNATTSVSVSNVCFTGPISKTGAAPLEIYMIRTRAYVGGSYTTLLALVQVSDLTVRSLTELSTF